MLECARKVGVNRRLTARAGRSVNPPEEPMKVGDEVRTAIALPGIPAGTRGVVKEIGRPFVVVAFADGRHGYYARRQLTSAPPRGASPALRAPESVPLGLDGARVPRASHTCLLPSSRAAAISVTARYVAAGLGNGETLLCFAPDKARAGLIRHLLDLGTDADRAIQRSQLTIAPPSSIYIPASRFDPVKQTRAVATFVSEATQKAPTGLRCCGFVGDMYKAKGWWQYEASITQVVRDYRFITLCVYDSSVQRAGIVDALYETHTHVLRDEVVTPGGAAP